MRQRWPPSRHEAIWRECMKQIIQNYKTGELKVDEVPTPQLRDGRVLVRTAYSVISAGTEKTKVDAGKKNLLGKARSRPDLVKQVVDKAKKEGIWKTWQTVSERLATPVALGYSSAGVVVDSLGDVGGLRKGDLVACAGSDACHAEMVCVPKNLVVPVPEGVTLSHAAFATIGSIAMQGVRQADVRLGENIAVIGLGLIGLLTVQILKASGCSVLGVDIDPQKTDLGREMGCDEVVDGSDGQLQDRMLAFTLGYGVDACIISAGTSSNKPIEQAGAITREKGRVVVLGAASMNVPREPYYLNEIDLRLSRSYGPGRYDPSYEDKGLDYPYGYVRFTEQRNMATFLGLLESGAIQLDPIVTHTFAIGDALAAYELIRGERQERYLGILLEYNGGEATPATRVDFGTAPKTGTLQIGVVGAGNYVTSALLPQLKKHKEVTLGSVCTGSGMTAAQVAQKFSFQAAESDVDKIIEESDAIVVGTRHNDHAPIALRALQAGTSVFVEKPLLIKQEELDQFKSFIASPPDATLLVGFNRRFSPPAQRVIDHFSSVDGPRHILIRVNAGFIPSDHWIQDPDVGGGRLLGEGCHFVDLSVALTGSRIRTIGTAAIPTPNRASALWDNFTLSIQMEDGSVACVHYTSIGNSGIDKEYIEVTAGGRTAVIHDFRAVDLLADRKKERVNFNGVTKGQKEQIEAWIKGLGSGKSPIPFDELINVHAGCLAAVQSMAQGTIVEL